MTKVCFSIHGDMENTHTMDMHTLCKLTVSYLRKGCVPVSEIWPDWSFSYMSEFWKRILVAKKLQLVAKKQGLGLSVGFIYLPYLNSWPPF